MFGTLVERTSSGRISDKWDGAILELQKRYDHGTFTNVVSRDGMFPCTYYSQGYTLKCPIVSGRFDLSLPTFVVRQLELEKVLEPILSVLSTIMGRPQPIIRTHNVVFVPVGCPAQQWHYDDSRKTPEGSKHRYFTILVNLNTIDSKCGGTEIRMLVDGELRTDLV